VFSGPFTISATDTIPDDYIPSRAGGFIYNPGGPR
jgi:hypothetical protein